MHINWVCWWFICYIWTESQWLPRFKAEKTHTYDEEDVLCTMRKQPQMDPQLSYITKNICDRNLSLSYAINWATTPTNNCICLVGVRLLFAVISLMIILSHGSYCCTCIHEKRQCVVRTYVHTYVHATGGMMRRGPVYIRTCVAYMWDKVTYVRTCGHTRRGEIKTVLVQVRMCVYEIQDFLMWLCSVILWGCYTMWRKGFLEVHEHTGRWMG